MARGHLDGLADYETAKVLKEDCDNCKGHNSRVRRLRELRKVYR